MNVYRSYRSILWTHASKNPIFLPVQVHELDRCKRSYTHFGEEGDNSRMIKKIANRYSLTSKKTSHTGPLFPPNRLATAQ